MKIAALMLAGLLLLSIGFLAAPISQPAYAHTFSGSESASFLSKVHTIEVEVRLAANNTDDAALAQSHADKAVNALDPKTLGEISEKNHRIASELDSLLTDLRTAVASSPIDKNSVSQTVSDLEAILGEAVSVRIEREQLTNSTIQAIVLADMIDEVLRDYGEAFDVGFDMTNMSLMAEGGDYGSMNHDDHSGMAEGSGENESDEVTVYRDSRFVDLSGKVLPADDFIHLYDATPYKIMNGHVAAKIPCNEDSESALQILIGQAPNMTAAEFETIPELSHPGGLCMYHVDLPSENEPSVTDVAILNPTNAPVTFPNTSTVVIGVNEIAALGEEERHGHDEGSSIVNMSAFQSAQAFAIKAVEIFQNDLKPISDGSVSDEVSKIESNLAALQDAVNTQKPAMDVMMIVHTGIHPNMQTAYNLQVIPEFPLPLLILIPALAALVFIGKLHRSGFGLP